MSAKYFKPILFTALLILIAVSSSPWVVLANECGSGGGGC